ncbi:hypothetical protein [Lysinibacillus sp. Ag94]|uniref:hypothetical protein n=1 Tax=unclassified Lysinibacillus TaxID=2636778 RepID=UPI00200C4826|nr:hypothetical protein [Lysinibacillus sp. Ag94]UPW85131.1 hypothetical protein MY533_09890 [Lysinibacillus sp. Ag94]
MKNYSNRILSIIILILLIIMIIATNKFIDFFTSNYPNLNNTEVISRITPPLLGAFFSGIVAIIVFYLNKIKEDITKRSQSDMFLQIIDKEITANIKSIEVICRIIESTTSKELAYTINNNTDTSERFKILCSNLSNEIIDKFLVQLNKNDYLIISEKVKNYKSLNNFLDLLNNDVTEVANKEIIIDKLKNLVDYFNNLQNIQEPKNVKKIMTLFEVFLKTKKNILIILFILIINAIINILLIKSLL